MERDESGKEGPDRQFPERLKPDTVRPMNPLEIPFYRGKLRPKDLQKMTVQQKKQGRKRKK